MTDPECKPGEGILAPFDGGCDPLLRGLVALERAVVLADGRHFYEAAAACDAILAILDHRRVEPGGGRHRHLRAQVWMCKGRALDGAGHHGEALACLDRALFQLSPARPGEAGGAAPEAGDYAQAMSLRGAALSHLGRPKQALATHRRAVSELRLMAARHGLGGPSEELARALTRQAASLMAAGRAREAEGALDEAIPIFDRLVFEPWREELACELEGALERRVEARRS